MKNSIQQPNWALEQEPRKLRDLVNQCRSVLNHRELVKKVGFTNNATPLSAWSEKMPTDCVWNVEYLIMGLDGSNNYARYHESKDVRRNGTAAPVVLATTVIEVAFEDVAAWAFTFDLGTETVGLSVIGAAATFIDWVVYIFVSEVI
jgi:hypothetical protein